jgi:hypothetical protein
MPRVGAVALAAALCACGGASPDPGLGGDLYVAGAQFVPGPLPSPSGGPSVAGLHFASTTLSPGAHDAPLLGSLDPTGTAAALGLVGDRGYFVVPAGVPDTEAPTEPTFTAALSFARTIAAGARTLEARAVDAARRFGPPTTLPLTVTSLALPQGALVVHLAWDGGADLDLHVVDPAGVEIWSRHLFGDGGGLDLDSNAGCHLDGRDQENVVYPTAAPPGRYVARVDAFALCGQPLADWRLDVLVEGAAIARASGTAYQADTRGDHGAGAGRTALTFDLP